MFETGLCREDANQCKISTGFLTPNCRFFVEIETTGDSIHFLVDGITEVDWGNNEWLIYEAGVVVGTQFEPGIGKPVMVRSDHEVKSIYFGNRASPDYTYLEIDILVALDLTDASRMCYNLVELTDFSFYKSNKVLSYESAWENCCNLVNFDALDISSALTIRKAWKNCGSLTRMIGFYSDTVLDAEEAFYYCTSMSMYSDIILESCTNWRRTFGHNTNLQIMNYLDTSEGTDFEDMFHYDRQLKCIMAVDTLKQKTTWNMFLGCTELESPNPQQQVLILNGYEWEQGRPCDDEEPCSGVYCENFNVYDINIHDYKRFIVVGGYPLMVGLNHFGCTGKNPPIPQPPFGYTCETEVDCPPCATFKSYSGSGIDFDNFIFSDGGEYFISTDYHGSCTGGQNPNLDYGYTCTVGVDCPDCVQLNVVNPQDTGFDRFVSIGATGHNVGTVHGGCQDPVDPPIELDYGYTCSVGIDCPDCITYKVLDKANGVFVTLKPVGSDIYSIGQYYGGCVGAAPSPITNFNATDTLINKVVLTWDEVTDFPVNSYRVYKDGSLLVDNVSSGYTYSSFVGTADFSIESYNGLGIETANNSGTGVEVPVGTSPASSPTTFAASDNLVGEIVMTWIDSEYGDLPITYSLYNGSTEIVSDITSPYSYVIADSTKSYFIRATNAYGSGDSLPDNGTSLPACIKYKVLNPYYDDENENSELYLNIVFKNNLTFTISSMHGSCAGGGGTTIDYGYTCEVDVDCPDCVDYHVLDIASWSSHKFNPALGDSYTIGEHHGGCAALPANPLTFGLQCVSGTDCPNCIQFNVLNSTDDGFEPFSNRSNKYYKIGHTSGSCSGTAPEPITGFTATTDQAGQVGLTWDASTVYPLVNYTVKRNNVTIKIGAVSPYIDSVAVGTYTYVLTASNSMGSNSVTADGRSLADTIAPNPPTNLIASDDRAGEIKFNWLNSTVGDDPIVYAIYRVDGTLVVDDVTSGHIEAIVAGSESYYIRAANAYGSANSFADIGTSLIDRANFDLLGIDDYLKTLDDEFFVVVI